MDIQLQELLEAIKREGVAAAEKQAAAIIANAEQKAKSIVAAAEEKAAAVVRDAEARAAQAESSGKAALQQAGRDLVLTVEKQLREIFNRLVAQAVQETYQAEVLAEAIIQVVTNWAAGLEGAEVLVSPQQAATVEAALKGKIGAALKQGVKIVPSNKVEAGFILAERNGAAYYDFTADAIAEALSVYLNPSLAAIITSKSS